MKKIIILVVTIALLGGLFVGCGGGGNTQPPAKPKTSTITVSVSDEGGNALSDVNLTMGDYSGKTVDNGKYTLNDVEAADYTIQASKDGYEDGSKDITVSAGENKAVTLTLKKIEEKAEELKDYSTEKSYKAVLEGKSSSGKTNKVIIIQDDYGKSQHITISTDGEEEFEMYLVGGKAKVLSDKQWMEIPSEQVQAMSAGYLNLLKGMVSGAEESYNIAIGNPDFSYKVKRIGRETVNGYPTTKYHMFAKVTSEEGIAASDMWIINNGPYEGYPTRMVINIKSSDGEETMTINVTDFGKDMGIKMP